MPVPAIVVSAAAKATEIQINLLSKLFGKSATRKAIEKMNQDAAYLQTVDIKQGKIITELLIGLGIAILALLFFLKR